MKEEHKQKCKFVVTYCESVCVCVFMYINCNTHPEARMQCYLMPWDNISLVLTTFYANLPGIFHPPHHHTIEILKLQTLGTKTLSRFLKFKTISSYFHRKDLLLLNHCPSNSCNSSCSLLPVYGELWGKQTPLHILPLPWCSSNRSFIVNGPRDHRHKPLKPLDQINTFCF